MALPAASSEAGPELDSAATASFGYWVRRRRLALDLTQAGLARAVNCATITIAKIERDERRPSRQMAALLADALTVPPDERAAFLAAALGETPVDRLTLDHEPLVPPAATNTGVQSNLPTPATPFAGRRGELEWLAATLAEPACRLLTLLGAGGFGKTRLAIRLGELALAQPEQFPDGVFFVALEGLEGGEFVIPAAAAALAFSFYEQEDQERQLLRYLAPKRMLLIFDNAEGILDPDLVLRILAQAPSVKILVTSRETLDLQQEWLHPIGGMNIDAPEDKGGDEDHKDQPREPDAVLFFRQCAVRVQPAFDLPRELVHVQRICRLVEGAPLAIELAATWLKALPCEQVARELARGIDLLATSMRDVAPRHRSMRAVLAQSWGYLAEDEQRVFRRLAVFEGGFRLEAAQAVVEAPLWVLAALVAKSMLQLRPDGRYYIHALLRQLGAEHLAALPEELATQRDRHTAYFMSYLAARRTALTGAAQMEALQEIQAEMDNIRAAWSHAAATGRRPSRHGELEALFRFLWMRGRYAEGEQMARQVPPVMDRAGLTDGEQAVRIALMAYAAQFAAAAGAYERALAEAQAALAEAQSIDSPPELAQCQFVVGMIQGQLRDHTAAIADLRAAHDLFRAQDNLLGVAETALLLGFHVLDSTADYASAVGYADEALAIYRALGDRFDLAEGLNVAAHVRWYGAGDAEESARLYQECLDTARAVENRLVVLQAVGGLAYDAQARGHWDLAIALQQERLALAQYLGHDPQVKTSLILLVAAYTYAGRYAEALALSNQHPEIWRNYTVAQAYVGTGDYAAGFAFLRQATADKLANSAVMPYIAIVLVGWAMLLASDCDLLMAREPMAPQMLPAGERNALAVEILLAVQAYPQCDPATRTRARRLLARHYEKIGKLAPDLPSPPVRSVRELAGAMMALRLA